ncbi:antibiotic biosynthesis monooxygenase family protein [Inquilinus sp. NPDC058860]|uniref:antibiotic biosynthesis monooxygenase family protein n=1 Tax=Inquilinus sp. NPDC058860 TaxID=3346652 RepID=UPI00367CB236
MERQDVTTIVLFEVPAQHASRFLSDWTASNDFMKQQSGLIDGTLYATADDNARYRFINVARWASETDLAEARKRHWEHLEAPSVNQREAWKTLGITVTPVNYAMVIIYSGTERAIEEEPR